MNQQNISIEIPEAALLAGVLHTPEEEPSALLVISHGLFSSKDSEKHTQVAEQAAEAGLAAVRFDHSGCGESPGDEYKVTLPRRKTEMLGAARWMQRKYPGKALMYCGSSLGGATCLAAAAELKPVRMVLWAAPWEFDELIGRFADDPEMSKLVDLAEDFKGYDLAPTLRECQGVLFIHGEDDAVIPVLQSQRAFALCGKPKHLITISGSDHSVSDPVKRNGAVRYTLRWLTNGRVR